MPQVIFGTVLMLAAIFILVATVMPSVRNSVRSELFRPQRRVLRIVNGNLMNDGQVTVAVKYKTVNGIVIEILSNDDNGARSLIDRITIPGEHDGYFDFYGQASQLAVMDVDDDGTYELVAPTFDEQLVAHLNVFKYNPIIKRFEPIQAPD